MTQIRLRRARPGDEEALALVGAATFLDAFIRDIPGAALVAHCTAQHSAGVYRSFLAAADPRHATWLVEMAATGAPVGYGVTCPPDLPCPTGAHDIEIKRIYCLSQLHGSGAGQALMDAALDHARGVAAPRIWLGTYRDNARAIAFYRRNGFQLAGTRQFRVGDQLFDDIVMAREI